MTATLRLRLGVNGERPEEKPSLDRKVEVQPFHPDPWLLRVAPATEAL